MHYRWRLGALLFALVVCVATVPRARKLGSPDFKVFYVAAQNVIHAPATVYTVTPDRYLYSPSTALLFVPFAFSGNYAFHQWVWHGLLGVALWFLAGSGGPALAAMVLLSRYLSITFGYGQIQLFVMVMMAGAGIWLVRRPQVAGALWALAVSVKVYPAVFAPAFLPKPQRKGVVAAVAVGTLLLLWPLLVFGPTLGLHLYGEFLGAIQSKGLPLHSHNQSWSALFLRLFTDQSFYLHSVGEIRWAFLTLPPALVKAAAFLLGTLLTIVSWRSAFRRNDAAAFLAAAAFSFLFLSHLVWKDYFLFLFFPLADLFRRAPRRAAVAVALLFLAMVTLSAPDVVGHFLSTRLDGACIHLWAAVLVWGAWLRYEKRPLHER